MNKEEHFQFKNIIENIKKFESTSKQKSSLCLLKNWEEYSFDKIRYLELISNCISRDLDTILFIKNIDMNDYPEFDIESSDFFSHFYTRITSENEFSLLNGDFFENIPTNSDNIFKQIDFKYCFDTHNLLINDNAYSFNLFREQINHFIKSAQLFYIENHHILNLLYDHYNDLNKENLYSFIMNPLENKSYLVMEIQELFKRMHKINQDIPEQERSLDHERYCSTLNEYNIPLKISSDNIFFIINELNLKQELKILCFIMQFSQNVCKNLSKNLISYSKNTDGSFEASFYFSEDEHQIKDFIYDKSITIRILDNNFSLKIDNSVYTINFEQNNLKTCLDLLCDFSRKEIQKFYKKGNTFYQEQYKNLVIEEILSFTDIDSKNINELVINIHPLCNLWINSVEVSFSIFSYEEKIFNFKQLFSTQSYGYKELRKMIPVLNSALEKSAISKKTKNNKEIENCKFKPKRI